MAPGDFGDDVEGTPESVTEPLGAFPYGHQLTLAPSLTARRTRRPVAEPFLSRGDRVTVAGKDRAVEDGSKKVGVNRGAACATAVDAAGPGDDRLAWLHGEYPRRRDPAVRAELAAAYDGFARLVARSLFTRRESTEDLVQVARIGLLHAIDRFNPAFGRPFIAFARPTITGELKRHIRDHTWAVKVHRAGQERFLEVTRARDDLLQELGRSPRINELAIRTGMSEEHVLEAMKIAARERPASLDGPVAEDGRSELADNDDFVEHVATADLVARLLSTMSDQEHAVLRLRFVEDLTQQEIAKRIGGNQMLVSRLLTRTLTRMRSMVCAS